MKKYFLFATIAVIAVACGNDPKVEQVEEKQRDSAIEVINDANEKLVDSLEKAMDAQAHADSTHAH